ncbi:MAG: hypothetical protein N2C14_24270, partial [Planctomycetales bacterium]
MTTFRILAAFACLLSLSAITGGAEFHELCARGNLPGMRRVLAANPSVIGLVDKSGYPPLY